MRKLFDMELSQQDELLMENTARGDILLSSTQGGMFRGERLRGNVTVSYTHLQGEIREAVGEQYGVL